MRHTFVFLFLNVAVFICMNVSMVFADCSGTVDRYEDGNDGIRFADGTDGPYVDNRNGTVTDQGTGLMWQQVDDGNHYTWSEACQYCDELTLGDYTNWELPDIYQLESIADNEYSPTININFFLNCKADDYWSGSTNADDTDQAWYLYFLNGSTISYPKSNDYYVRCVRSAGTSGPGTVIPVSPSGTTDETTPIFTWNEDPASTWYKLFIGDSSEEKVYAQWYDASNICSGGSCLVALESELLKDNYEWWVKSWNNYGSVWSDGMSFTVQEDDTPPSKVAHTSPTGATNETTPTFTWVADLTSTWYKLWVGYPGDIKVFGEWYEASDICSDGNCSVILETELMDGDYEWYIKSWNDYGNVWSDGMSFSVQVSLNTYYRDIDSDGYGNPNNSTESSFQPSGYVTDNTDCDDSDNSVYPGATEIIGDGIDQDCNGSDLQDADAYYVATTGSDSIGNGSLTEPYRTIQFALDQAASGDTIILRNGTYNENIRIRKANTTLQSYTNEWAVIQSPINDEEKDITLTFDTDSDGSRLQRVEVIGGYWYGIKFNTKWDWGDENDRTGASNIIIEDCKIHDTGNACIKVTPGCDDITIRRCEIYNSGRTRSDSAEAIDNVNGDRMTVEQCNIHDITATGLYAKGGAIGTTIDRTIVKDCGGAGILIGFDTSPEFFDTTINPDYYENISGTVKNCVVVNTQYAGIGLYAAKDAIIFNNTLVDVAQDGHSGLYFGLTYQDWDETALRPSSINPIIKNNIVVQSENYNSTMVEIRYDDELGGLSALSGMPAISNNQYYVINGTAFFEDNRPTNLFSGNFNQWKNHISGDTESSEGDPLFLNYANGDYHLSSASPCIDAGSSQNAPDTDYDGSVRPQQAGYDIGAFEASAQ